MVLEVAILNIKPGKVKEFERTFRRAEKIISSMQGYVSHELKRCMEVDNKYILLVNWRSIEDHEIGFRMSPEYQEWKSLLHHFYDPFPVVEHFEALDD